MAKSFLIIKNYAPLLSRGLGVIIRGRGRGWKLMEMKVLVNGVEEYSTSIDDVTAIDLLQQFGEKQVAGRLDHNSLNSLAISVESGAAPASEGIPNQHTD